MTPTPELPCGPQVWREPHLPAANTTGRQRAWPMREIFNCIFYVMRAGSWHLLQDAQMIAGSAKETDMTKFAIAALVTFAPRGYGIARTSRHHL
jgi:transposase